MQCSLGPPSGLRRRTGPSGLGTDSSGFVTVLQLWGDGRHREYWGGRRDADPGTARSVAHEVVVLLTRENSSSTTASVGSSRDTLYLTEALPTGSTAS